MSTLLDARIATRFFTFGAMLCASLLTTPVNAATGDTTLERVPASMLPAVRRNHGEADTLLVSLRDDVYRAVLLGARGDTAYVGEIRKAFAQNASNLKARIDAYGELGIDDSLWPGLRALQVTLDTCVRSASELIALAGDQAQSVPELDRFEARFETLKTAMSAFRDLVDVKARQGSRAVAQDRGLPPAATASVSALGMVLLPLFGLLAYRKYASRVAE